ncbi:hypothetical protein [Streptomyces sp. NPDC049813]|uniref:hypothetical protein n=1 Tax=Streptomyces sp. NPDC049813 TaxID=3365597 RepID=UPI0037A23A02
MDDVQTPHPVLPAPPAEPPRPPGPPHRRRGRTTALIACAVALGAVAGVCTGYIVQADRAPDRLAALSQPSVAQAEGVAPPPSAAHDRAVRTEGDLRRLLLSPPRGARDRSGGTGDDAWMDAAQVAETYDRPEWAFSALLKNGFRRAASVKWTEGALDVEIRLTQYRDLEDTSAGDAVLTQQSSMGLRFEKDSPDDLPGSGTGLVYVSSRTDPETGRYEAEAVAGRGDLMMDLWISSDRPIGKKRAMQLARAQWGRM